MNRSRIALALAACLTLGVNVVVRADVRTEEKTKFQLAGALGKVINFFGGKAAREGVTSSVAVKGNRMLTMTDTSGQLVDLSEEKVYNIDVKKKSYEVVTFAEIRRQMEENRRKAEEEARKEEAQARKDGGKAEPAERDPNAKELDVDFEVKNTGEKKSINGFDTTQSIMTITVREKGKTLQQSGGMVLTSDIWLTPSVPSMKEVAEFNAKYWKQLYGPMMAGASPQDMASAMALYPMMKPALEKMAAEGSKMQGTPILTTTTIDAVKSAEQVAAEQNAASSDSGSSSSAPPTSVGGLLGGFGKRMAQRKNNDQAAAAPKDRATVVTTTSETLKVATTVSDAEVAIPAGFKQAR